MATFKALALTLALVGCGAPDAREVATAPPDDTGSAGAPTEPPSSPVDCGAEVSAGSLAYFTESDCRPSSRLVPIVAGDPISSAVLCELGDDGEPVRAWVTSERAPTPSAVWGGADCRDLSSMVESFEWWQVVEVPLGG